MRCWAALLAVLVSVSAQALEFEASAQVTRTEVRVPSGPPGSPLVQSAFDRTWLQAVLSHRQEVLPGWSLSGSGWGSIDTLPSENPTVLSSSKAEASARILEVLVQGEVVPAVLVFDAGKKVIHPSSGFSATPLNVLSRGDSGSDGRATAAWEEGWYQASVTWLSPWATFSTAYLPGLSFAAGQPRWSELTRLTGHAFDADVQALVLASEEGLSVVGAGIDWGWGDSLTLRTEGTWKPTGRGQTLCGATWSDAQSHSVMAEYSLEGLTSSIKQYGFVRLASPLDPQLDAEAWVKVNIQGGGGWEGLTTTLKFDHASLNLRWQNAWGGPGTEAGDSPLLWKAEAQWKVFF